MLHSLPQPQSPTVRPTSGTLDMQATSLEYSTSREMPPLSTASSAQKYEQDHHHPSKTMSSNDTTSSSVKADSPTRSCPNVSMSQPTTPRPTGSPTLQPIQSLTQPPSPREGFQQPQQQREQQQHQDQESPMQPPAYMINNGIRRKRRESDYTSDTPTFGMTHYHGNIYATDKSTILDVRIQSKVDRGFFLADNDWTCYRRNYFQISSSFSLQGVVVLYDGQELPCLVEDQDMLHEVQQFHLGISARLSDCDKKISLIQHTAKRDKGPQNTPEPKPIRPGGNLSFSSVGANQSIVTFERIQFKSATANNGKRRAAQQYYVVVMELYAEIRSTGKMVPVATTESQALVVRGRSPGHYAESHGSSSTSSSTAMNDASVGGPMRRQHHPHPHHHQQHQHHHANTALTSPPMIPGHPHTPTYPSHAAPPSAPDYPPYDYPPSAYGGNGIHYAYAPHAGVPMVPSGPHSHPSTSSSNGSYDYHASPTTPHHHQHQQQQLPSPHPPQHSYPAAQSMPPRSEPPSVYDHSYPHHHPSQQPQQHYVPLPPPMHRSESAPSAYDHFKDEEQQQQQQQHWARVRMSSTPGQHHAHPGNHSPTTDHNGGPPFLPHPSAASTTPTHEHHPHGTHPSQQHQQHQHQQPSQQQHHTYYSQHPSHPQAPVPYYHHSHSQQQPPPSPYGHPPHPESTTAPVDVSTYHHSYPSNWQQWRQQGNVSHQVEEYSQTRKEDNVTKMEPKSLK